MDNTREKELYFIKLGGSLITDKSTRETLQPGIIKTIAQEIKRFRDNSTAIDLLIGNGSGSFGHWEAKNYNTRSGVLTPEQWHGFARVSAAASHLNRLVVDIFLEAGLPILSLQPSASIEAKSGTILDFNAQNMINCLKHHLIPLIFGDVAFDSSLGGTIFSTEDLFVYLTPILKPSRIILLGNSPGVLNNQRQIIPKITPQNYQEITQHLHGSRYTDVTGGMADKVKRMVELVEVDANLKVHIMTGRESGVLRKTLLNNEYSGTIICHS